MKTTIKLIMFVCVALAISVSSCTKDGEIGSIGPAGTNGIDGTDGVDGIDGTNGTNGLDGEDGADGLDGLDGQDGNPNIRTFTFDMSTESGDRAQFESSEFTNTLIKNSAILWYIDADIVTYQVPGIGPFAHSKYEPLFSQV